MLSLALMTIFMKKYFSSIGIKSTGWHPLRIYLLLQQAVQMEYIGPCYGTIYCF